MNRGINLQLFATPQPQEEAERDKQFKAMQRFLKSRGEVNAGHGSIEGESKAVALAKSLPVYSDQVDESILKQYM